MVLYPNSPGTFIQELILNPTVVAGGIKTAVILGETSYAFEGAPDFQKPVYVAGPAALSAKYNQLGTGIAGVANPLYEQGYRHFKAGGGPAYFCQVGPVGTFIATPTCITADVSTETTGGTLLRSIKWWVAVTEYVTNGLVTKGETLASDGAATITMGGSTDTNKITVAHTKSGSATGWNVYMRKEGERGWYFAGTGTGATIDVTATPTVLPSALPKRSEALVSQTAAAIGDWGAGLTKAEGINVHVVCAAAGMAGRSDNLDLMDIFSDHCEKMYSDAYVKRLAVCPAIAGETHYQRINTSDYYNTSDRLVKVALNGTEGYVSGAICARNFDESITFYSLPSADPTECYQGGSSYPLNKAERDSEYALGWTLLKPFEEGVRITKGVTAQAGADSPTVFKELFVRTVIDHIIEMLEREGDAFIGSGHAMQNQASRAILQAAYTGILNNMKNRAAIDDFSISVIANADGNVNAVDVAFWIDVGHEINQIFGYMTVGG